MHSPNSATLVSPTLSSSSCATQPVCQRAPLPSPLPGGATPLPPVPAGCQEWASTEPARQLWGSLCCTQLGVFSWPNSWHLQQNPEMGLSFQRGCILPPATLPPALTTEGWSDRSFRPSLGLRAGPGVPEKGVRATWGAAVANLPSSPMLELLCPPAAPAASPGAVPDQPCLLPAQQWGLAH